MSQIQLEPKHEAIVREILCQFQLSAYVFGSRSKGTAKPFSDLDLCLKDSLEKSTARKLQNAFEESDLPFKVDVIIWSEISESFQKQIEKDLIKIE